MGNTQAVWKPLAPIGIKGFPCPIVIDDKYILFVADKTKENNNSNCIIVYDIKNNCYPPQMQKKHPENNYFYGQSIAYNAADKLVYVFGGKNNKCLMIYDVNADEWIAKVHGNTSDKIAYKMNVQQVGQRCGIIFDSHGVLHVVAGSKSNRHYAWNDEQQKFIDIFQFPFQDNYLFGLVSDAMNNRLIIFGGQSGSGRKPFDNIGFFDLSTNEWKKSDLKLDIPLSTFGFIFLESIQLIIIFCGFSGEESNDNIRFVDLLKETVSISNFNCPASGNLKAVLIHDKKNSKLIIHLFQWTSKHWSIDLFHILPLQYHQRVCKHYNLSAAVYQSTVYAAEEKKEEKGDANNSNVRGISNDNNSGKPVINDLPMKQQSFKTYFYETAKGADIYYQTFVDKEFNDLDILMEFESSDLSVLMGECHMNRMHAKHLLKQIKVLKEKNVDFQQWLASIGMKKKYYSQMIEGGIATLAMLEQKFVCVTDFVVFLGGENDDEIEMDGICIWENMPKNSKKKSRNNNNEFDNSVTVGNNSGIKTASYGSEGDEGDEGIAVTNK